MVYLSVFVFLSEGSKCGSVGFSTWLGELTWLMSKRNTSSNVLVDARDLVVNCFTVNYQDRFSYLRWYDHVVIKRVSK